MKKVWVESGSGHVRTTVVAARQRKMSLVLEVRGL